jgi:hypothetical protein
MRPRVRVQTHRGPSRVDAAGALRCITRGARTLNRATLALPGPSLTETGA